MLKECAMRNIICQIPAKAILMMVIQTSQVAAGNMQSNISSWMSQAQHHDRQRGRVYSTHRLEVSSVFGRTTVHDNNYLRDIKS